MPIFTCDEVRGRRSTDDIRPWEILEIVAVEAWKAVAIGVVEVTEFKFEVRSDLRGHWQPQRPLLDNQP